LPEGIIRVDTGLMRSLDSAEQMAGFLDHDLSYMSHWDPLTGGRGGALARTLVQNFVNVCCGREAEDRADVFAVQLPAWATIVPCVFERALQRIRKVKPKDPKLHLLIETHSPIDERIVRATEEESKPSAMPRTIGVNWHRLFKEIPKSEE
jgi:hypothetical protein